MLSLLLVLLPLQDEPEYRPPIAPPSGEGRLAMDAFELLDGFKASLWAEEPMLANPVCLYVSGTGDCYVAEAFRTNAGVTDMREHRDWLDEDLANRTVEQRVEMMARHEGEDFAKYSEQHERIRLIRDTDGDGKADQAVVFADGFNDPADGIGAGLLERDGKLWYTCIPKLWLLEDTDGDDKADQREVLSDGYGVNISLLGHDLHGLRIGPDRRLYFSIGDRGFHVETESGTLAHAHTGGVLRCNLDGSGLELFATGLRNPQELVFDDYGNLFTGDNNSDGGDKARWVQVVEGADSGWRYAYQWLTTPLMRGPWNDEKLWWPWFEGQAAYILPPVANLANGPSGLTIYPGTGFGNEWLDHFFLCEFRGDARHSGILTFKVEPKGAGFTLGKVERFLWRSLATDADFGPDGALWVSDWVHGWTQTGKGRIYRVTRTGMEEGDALEKTRKLIAEGPAGMAARSVEELSALLGHADRRVRQEAHFALADRGPEGVQAMFHVARRQNVMGTVLGIRKQLHAIWGLGIAARTEPQAKSALVDLLRSQDDEIIAQVLKVLGDVRYFPPRSDSHPNWFGGHLASRSARVKLYAALGLYRIGDSRSEPDVVKFIEENSAKDPVLRHAGVMALSTCSTKEGFVRAMVSNSRSVREAALLVLRRRRDPRIAEFLHDADPLLVLEAARAIYDEGPIHADGALEALAELPLTAGASNALARRVLGANLFTGEPAGASRLAAAALREDLSLLLRLEAVEFLVRWPRSSAVDPITGEYRTPYHRAPRLAAEECAALGHALEGGPLELQLAWTRLAAISADQQTTELLTAWTLDTERPASVRAAAIDALTAGSSSLGNALDELALCSSPVVRAAALRQLTMRSPERALPLLDAAFEAGGVATQRAVFAGLSQLGTPAADERLLRELERLEQGLVPAETRLELIEAVETRAASNEDIARQLELRRVLHAEDEELQPYLDGLFGGDKRRGASVYRRTETSCLRCHQVPSVNGVPGVALEGGIVGPALSGIGSRLSRVELAESIVHPNRRVADEYRSITLETSDGEILSGRVLFESSTLMRLIDADGKEFELDTTEIESRSTGLSAMPQDLHAQLSPHDMRDLLAYLGSL